MPEKTPDEIKKGLECCSLIRNEGCRGCPYQNPAIGMSRCKRANEADALAYIQQLEAANAELLTKVKQLEKKCHQLESDKKRLMENAEILSVAVDRLEQERDAAVADIPRACGYCKWFEINLGGNMTDCHNPNGCRNISGINTGWEWRGVKEE